MESGRSAFYQQHLDRVSRSFAFCIARLESPLRETVGLGYLLCRILDTIEDAAWIDFDAQESSFLEFDHYLKEPPTAARVEAWVSCFPKGLPEGESHLLVDTYRVFCDYHALSTEEREALRGPIESMSGGMRHYMEKKARGGALRLENLIDVNRYCFFVAGVVGEMLTRLLVQHAKSATVSWSDAFRFGLFLQKVNLLKDQAGDEKAGRYLVPSRSLVKASLAQDAEKAMHYLASLPGSMIGFRLFCAWSLFLGLASLPFIERSAHENAQVKIPREETAKLLAAVESRITDDKALRELFDTLSRHSLSDLGSRSETVAASDPSAEETTLLGLYRGVLGKDQVRALFNGV